MLEEVHLPEQVLLLRLAQERHLVERGQLGRHVFRRPQRGLGVGESGRVRHRPEDLRLLRRVVEGGVVDVVGQLLGQLFGPDFADHSVHRSPSPVKSFREGVHGNPPPVGVEDQLLDGPVEGTGHAGEDGRSWMGAVEVLDRVADRLGRPSQSAGESAADLGQRPAGGGEPAGGADDLFLFVVAQVREPAAALDLALVRRHELLDDGSREAEVPTAVVQYPPADQVVHRLPTAKGLRRHVQKLADLFERQHRLGRPLDRHGRQRTVQPVDEQPQIVVQVVAGNQQVRVRVRPEAGETEADELVRVLLLDVDAAEELARLGQLLAPLGRGRVPHLLVRQLLQRRVSEVAHDTLASLRDVRSPVSLMLLHVPSRSY